MLKSCKYCGRIHDEKHVCEQRRQAEEKRWRNRKKTNALNFRRSKAWTDKSISIRKRDAYMCVCCKAMLEKTVRQYNTTDLSVHHIIPIEEDYSKRLDEDNLITVCDVHHEMCEAGIIKRDVQRRLARAAVAGDDGEDAECLIV